MDEIVVIEDGSQDKTAQIVRELTQTDNHICLISLPEKQGKGKAVLAGGDASRNDILLFVDSDLFVHDRLERKFPIKLKQLKWHLEDKNASYFDF